MTSYARGTKVTTPVAFTTPTGIHFPAGTIFTVHISGRSSLLVADRCGSVVWVSDGCFLTNR